MYVIKDEDVHQIQDLSECVLLILNPLVSIYQKRPAFYELVSSVTLYQQMTLYRLSELIHNNQLYWRSNT